MMINSDSSHTVPGTIVKSACVTDSFLNIDM